MRIGVDLMGSDTAPLVLFEAVVQALGLLNKEDTLVVFATPDIVDLLQEKSLHPGIEWFVSSEFISMSDDPLKAIRQKRKSSLQLGIKELKKGFLDAFVSAGNTGALLSSSALYLNKFLKIERPALLALLPSKKQFVAVIDVGGNTTAKANHLVQFALMGAAYQSSYLNLKRPKVGLLNMGAESKKGTMEVRLAYEYLKVNAFKEMEFIGNIEGQDVFDGKVDVVVTGGMAGNILLKTAEGVSSFIFDTLEANVDLFHENGKQAFQNLKQQFNYEEYPGALVAGVDGIVIKCHGEGSVRAMYHSIKAAILLNQQNVLSKMKAYLN